MQYFVSIIAVHVCMCIYVCIYIHDNHRNFRPIHFSTYGNLKVILETAFRHLSFQVSSGHLPISKYKVCWPYSFTLEID